MKKINMHEAKTHLSRIVERVAQGESVLIAKAGKPMAILSPYTPPKKIKKPGTLKGKIRMTADFDEADELITNLFHIGSDKD
jgi:prevent-host-death family protein